MTAAVAVQTAVLRELLDRARLLDVVREHYELTGDPGDRVRSSELAYVVARATGFDRARLALPPWWYTKLARAIAIGGFGRIRSHGCTWVTLCRPRAA